MSHNTFDYLNNIFQNTSILLYLYTYVLIKLIYKKSKPLKIHSRK